jgi:hypothetical protein
MKYFVFLLSLLFVTTTFSQSKKELRKMVDSLENRISHLNSAVNTLKTEKFQKDVRIEYLERSNEIEVLKRENVLLKNAQLRIELQKLYDRYPEAIPTTTLERSSNEVTIKEHNPFGGGGSGNEGDGDGKFGKDEGSGSGSGPGGLGDGTGRTRLNDPKVDDIRSDQNHTIHLRAQINSDGKIVAITNIEYKTTTKDEKIIDQVMSAIKTQVRYSKKEGADNEVVYITVKLNAN